MRPQSGNFTDRSDPVTVMTGTKTMFTEGTSANDQRQVIQQTLEEVQSGKAKLATLIQHDRTLAGQQVVAVAKDGSFESKNMKIQAGVTLT